MTEDGRGSYLHQDLTERIIAAAIKVQCALGPGLLESAYEACLVHELRRGGLKVETQVALWIQYEGLQVPGAFRMDLVVEGLVVVELKTVDRLLDLHFAQVKSYLRFSGMELGLLLNFWCWPLKAGGIRRVANSQKKPLRPSPPLHPLRM